MLENPVQTHGATTPTGVIVVIAKSRRVRAQRAARRIQAQRAARRIKARRADRNIRKHWTIATSIATTATLAINIQFNARLTRYTKNTSPAQRNNWRTKLTLKGSR
jgi:hypothetical protein